MMNTFVHGELHIDLVRGDLRVPALIVIDEKGIAVQLLDSTGELIAETVTEIYEDGAHSLSWNVQEVGGDPTSRLLATSAEIKAKIRQ